jgi:hypothetical protein
MTTIILLKCMQLLKHMNVHNENAAVNVTGCHSLLCALDRLWSSAWNVLRRDGSVRAIGSGTQPACLPACLPNCTAVNT